MPNPSQGIRSIPLSRERDGGDAQLVARMAAGDERALGSLYDMHGAAVYGLAVAITRNQATAESVVTDAFATVWREARSFDPARRSVFAWLCSTVRALALAQRRSAGVAIEPEVRVVTDASPLGEALSRLTAPQRTSIELAYFRGYSRSEIARELGATEAAVGAWLRTAMEALRHVLHAEAPTAMAAEPSAQRVAGI